MKDLAKRLQGKFGVVACDDQIDGLKQIVLTPKSVSPAQQLAYGSSYSGGVNYKLLDARFFDHYLVLKFDKQTQYLDLEKMENGAFALAGFVADRNASRFEDDAAFADALKNYMGIAPSAPDAKAAEELAARVKQAVGENKHRLNGSLVNGELVVIVTAQGETSGIWPKVTKREGKP